MAAVEQVLLAGGSDSLSPPIPSLQPLALPAAEAATAQIEDPMPSAVPAAATAASAQLEDSKPSASPAAAVASSSQIEDPKPSTSPAALMATSAELEDSKPSASPAGAAAASSKLEDPKPSASPEAVLAASTRAKRCWLRPMVKVVSWPVRRVFHGMGRVCDMLVCASRRPVVVRLVAKIDALIPDRVRGAVSRVLLMFDSLPTGSEELPISDPALLRLYIEPNMERIGLLILALVAAGAVLFVTLEGSLEAVCKISGFYDNVKWHLAEAERMRQEAAEQLIQILTPATKKLLPPPASEQQPPPPATEQQPPPPAVELLIPTPPPPEMDIC